jgi:2'-5' RNA ligase
MSNEIKKIQNNSLGQLDPKMMKPQEKRGTPQKRQKPNFFIAFKIDEESIKEKCSKVIERLQKVYSDFILSEMKKNNKTKREQEEELKIALTKSFTSNQKLHCTLMVLHIPKGILEHVKFAFQSKSKLFESLKSLEVNLQGIGSFGEKVIWMGFDQQSKSTLSSFVGNIRSFFENVENHSSFSNIGFEDREYFPHVTLWKDSSHGKSKRTKYMNKSQNIKKDEKESLSTIATTSTSTNSDEKVNSNEPKPFVDPSNWFEFKEILFGIQKIKRIELLEIGSTDQNGAYKQHAFLDLTE